MCPENVPPTFECRISRYQLTSGVLYVPTRARSAFPKGYDKAPVKVFLDEESTAPILLSYDPYNHLLWGLRKWHLQHEARQGDIVIIEPLDLTSTPPEYRLRLRKEK